MNYNMNTNNSYESDKYYKESGRIKFSGIMLMLVFGIVGSIILSLVYSYANKLIPFVYLNVLFALGYGYAIVFLVSKAAKIGEIRNRRLVIGFVLIIAIFGEYANFVSWLYVTSDYALFIISPSEIKIVLQFLAIDGVWGFRGSTVKGWALYAVWIIEACILIGLPVFIEITKKVVPFCEDCVRWIEDKKTASFFDTILDVGDLKYRLEIGDFSVIESLKRTNFQASNYSQIELLKCTQCDEKFYLNVNSVTISYNSKNKPETKVVSLINNLVIDATTYSRLEKFISTNPN